MNTNDIQVGSEVLVKHTPHGRFNSYEPELKAVKVVRLTKTLVIVADKVWKNSEWVDGERSFKLGAYGLREHGVDVESYRRDELITDLKEISKALSDDMARKSRRKLESRGCDAIARLTEKFSGSFKMKARSDAEINALIEAAEKLLAE